MKTFEELTTELSSLNEWMLNDRRTDSQDGKFYRLIFSAKVHQVDFCGQAYAGANNYHGCPNGLVKFVQDEVNASGVNLVYAAVKKYRDSLSKEILEKEADMLAALSAAKSLILPKTD